MGHKRTPSQIEATRREITNLISTFPGITAKELAEHLRMSVQAVSGDLYTMGTRKLITTEGERYYIAGSAPCLLAKVLIPPPPSGDFPTHRYKEKAVKGGHRPTSIGISSSLAPSALFND